MFPWTMQIFGPLGILDEIAGFFVQNHYVPCRLRDSVGISSDARQVIFGWNTPGKFNIAPEKLPSQ